MTNQIYAIAPYRHAGIWVFDDEARDLKGEAFVGGVTEILDVMVEEAGIDLDRAASGFRLLFSADPFPDYQFVAEWKEGGQNGNTYVVEMDKDDVMVGWLCPALFRYFDKAPVRIYAKAEAIND